MISNLGIKQNVIKNFLPKHKELGVMSDFFSSFADPTRLKILSALCLSPMCVSELCQAIEVNQTTVSHQLKTMRERGLVDFSRFGKLLRYEISSSFVSQTLECGVDFLNNLQDENFQNN